MLSQAMAQRIEHWSLDKLIPYPKNPRRHSGAQITQIAGSIAAFGFNAPILVDAKGGILAGHGRYLAALKLGLDTVPVVILDHLSEIEKRAYLLADNKLAELSSFDDELLRAELAVLRDADIDLGALGFDDNELAVLLADAESPVPDADPEEEEIPEPPAEPVTRTGDLWSISGHRLVCGDCRDRDLVHRLFDGARANLVITSPPYATQREYDKSSGFTPIPPERYIDWSKGSGTGGSWTTYAGSRAMGESQVAGRTALRTLGSRFSISPASPRSSSPPRQWGTSPKIA